MFFLLKNQESPQKYTTDRTQNDKMQLSALCSSLGMTAVMDNKNLLHARSIHYLHSGSRSQNCAQWSFGVLKIELVRSGKASNQ